MIVIGLLALATGVSVLVVNAIKKRGLKLWSIVAASGLALLIIGCVIPPSAEEFRITSLTVAPKEVIAGESIMIMANVENTGEAEGIYHAVLVIDGEETEARSIALAAREEETISFTITANTSGSHIIELGGLTDTFKVLRPVKLVVSSLAITPNPAKVGEEVTVKINVENTGETEGTYIASLVVDGVGEQTKNITLAWGATQSVTFVISKDSCGSYGIEIGGLKDILKVIQPVRLSTGTFLAEKLRGGEGELTIENGLNLDALMILSSPEEPKIPLSAVYIRAKDSYTIGGIKDGTYILYYALGEDWDSCSQMFTTETTYERFEDEFDFETTESAYMIYYTTYEATLHPVTGGTAETEPVSEDEFPGLG